MYSILHDTFNSAILNQCYIYISAISVCHSTTIFVLEFIYSTEIVVKQEIKEEVKDSDEEQGIEDSNVDTDNLVDGSKYVQVQMNLSNLTK